MDNEKSSYESIYSNDGCSKKAKKRKWIIIATSIAGIIIALLLTATQTCVFSHEWTEPNCTKPQICQRCGNTNGEALGHDWENATCTKPQTCIRCKTTMGKQLGHTESDWIVDKEVTCTEDGLKYTECSVCHEKVKEEVLNHTGHSETEWIADKEATCTADGLKHTECSVCHSRINEEVIPHTGHAVGEWEISKTATVDASGEKVQKCTKCGEIINRSTYELTASQKREIKNKELAKQCVVTYSSVDFSDYEYDGYKYVNYRVKNNSSQTVSVEVLVTLCDAGGNAVTSETSYIWNIPPNQSADDRAIIRWTGHTPKCTAKVVNVH